MWLLRPFWGMTPLGMLGIAVIWRGRRVLEQSESLLPDRMHKSQVSWCIPVSKSHFSNLVYPVVLEGCFWIVQVKVWHWPQTVRAFPVIGGGQRFYPKHLYFFQWVLGCCGVWCLFWFGLFFPPAFCLFVLFFFWFCFWFCFFQEVRSNSVILGWEQLMRDMKGWL